MLVIRFLRTGKKNQPSFKIVVAEKTRSSTSGRFIEEVGNYNPRTKEKVLKQDRIKYWILVGAKPLETVHNLLVSEKIIGGKKIRIYRKPKKEKEAAPAEIPAVEAPPEKPTEPPVAAEKPAEKSAEEQSKEKKEKEEQPKTE